MATQKDARGNVVTYTTNTESGLVTKITDPAGNEVTYVYGGKTGRIVIGERFVLQWW